MLFIDNFSCKTQVYFLREKSDTFETFKNFELMVENQSGYKIKDLCSNHGGEYIAKKFYNFCEEHGIHHCLTVLMLPQQNGIAERKNRTVIETARSMLKTKQLPKEFLG